MRSLVIGSLALALLGSGLGAGAQQSAPDPLGQCQSTLRVRQDLLAYTENISATLLRRAEQAEQTLAQVKQAQERTEEELARVRQAWEALKAQQSTN